MGRNLNAACIWPPGCSLDMSAVGSVLTADGPETRDEVGTGWWSGALTALTFSLIHTGRRLNGDFMLKICLKKAEFTYLQSLMQLLGLHFLFNPPDGRLMQFPSLPSLRRLFLKLPLRFLTCGFSWYI